MADDETPKPQILLIGIYPMPEAERIRTLLKRQNVDVMFNHNQQTCRGGCATQVEILAHIKDLEKVKEFLIKEKSKQLDGFQMDPNAAGQVFDPSKSEATCPACGTVFSTTKMECPECGLAFG